MLEIMRITKLLENLEEIILCTILTVMLAVCLNISTTHWCVITMKESIVLRCKTLLGDLVKTSQWSICLSILREQLMNDCRFHQSKHVILLHNKFLSIALMQFACGKLHYCYGKKFFSNKLNINNNTF